MPRGPHLLRPALGVVLAATVATLALGYLIKLPCQGSWADGRQYRRLCYSDVAALYGHRGLDRDEVPYLEADNEYPVLSGFAMYAAAVPARSYASFFNWTALLLTACALVTAWALHRAAGWRALLFALAPTLAVYGFVNWDLVAVALATAGTLAFLRGRDGISGVLLGLGAAAKLYPVLLVVPFVAGRLAERRPAAARNLGIAAAFGWAAVNVPVAVAAPDRWSAFFRFNAERGADWDSLWFMIQRHLGFVWDTGVLNLLSALAFVVLAGVLWVAAARRRPGFPAWTLGFPILVAFLLTNKVYSPQYSLWLLPWFALALPDLRLFAAFSVADVAVFVTRFLWFAERELGDGLPFWTFEAAVLVRAAILVGCLVAWVRRDAPAPILDGVEASRAA